MLWLYDVLLHNADGVFDLTTTNVADVITNHYGKIKCLWVQNLAKDHMNIPVATSVLIMHTGLAPICRIGEDADFTHNAAQMAT